MEAEDSLVVSAIDVLGGRVIFNYNLYIYSVITIEPWESKGKIGLLPAKNR